MKIEYKLSFILIFGMSFFSTLVHSNESTISGNPIKVARKDGKSVIAVVNGTPIFAEASDVIFEKEGKKVKDPIRLREIIKERLISRTLLLQEAAKLGLSSDDTNIDVSAEDGTINTFLKYYSKKNPVTDSMIKSEYERFVADMGNTEYYVFHLLYKSKEEAEKAITMLNSGAKFDELALSSSDFESGKKGGSLGWSDPTSFVKLFSDAMVTIPKGKISLQPVQTQFGYHVIKVEDTRPIATPQLAPLRKRIADFLLKKQLDQLVLELKRKSIIEDGPEMNTNLLPVFIENKLEESEPKKAISTASPVQKLRDLDTLRKEGIINDEDFNKKKKELLKLM